MEWKEVWRRGFAPLLSREALESLKYALETDDARLLQGATTIPPPLQCVQDWPCEAACPIGYAGASEMGGLLPQGVITKQGHPCATVGEVEEFFARACFAADQAMSEPAACRWLLNWFDETPRPEMIRELLPEVVLALAGRESDHVAAAPGRIGADPLDMDCDCDIGGES